MTSDDQLTAAGCTRYFTFRALITWIALCSVLCLLYAVIAFVALIDKNILSDEPGPQVIPYVNVPKRYDVHLQFNTEYNQSSTSYSGRVTILFHCRVVSRHIFIHRSKNLRISSIKLLVLNQTKATQSVKKGAYNADAEIQTFVLKYDTVKDHLYMFTLDFSSKKTSKDGPNEFSYATHNGSKRFGVWFATIQRHGKGLRYLFPCMDSNEFPAEFNVTVARKVSLRALSNSYVMQSTPRGTQFMMDHFPPTTIISPYQFTLVLCNFQYKSESHNGTEISIYSRSDILQFASFRRVIQFMDSASRVIGKNDAIVIPNVKTIYRPGISLINEDEFVSENQQLMMISSHNGK